VRDRDEKCEMCQSGKRARPRVNVGALGDAGMEIGHIT
jgi:hypothetical protein